MLNKVQLIGRLGKDPETRYMTNGEAVTNVSLATSENYKDKSGEKQEKTEWHRVVAWRKLGEIVGEYLKKGRLVYIEGKIQSREYEGKDGVKRRTFEIVASEMKMIGGGGATQTGEERKPYANHNNDEDFVPEIEEDDVPL